MVPYLQALASAGHEVRVASGAHFLKYVERAGLDGVVAGLDWGTRHAPPALTDAVALENEVQMREAMLAFFAGPAARSMANDLLDLTDAWRPDIVLSDWTEFGASVVAETLNIPYLPISVGMRLPPAGLEVVAKELHALRDRHGLAADQDLGAPYRFGCLSLFPREWLPEEQPPFEGEVFFNPAPEWHDESEAGPWLASLPDPPVVYATLGSIFSVLPGPLEALIDGLGHGPWSVIVATGGMRDPEAFTGLPDNLRVESWVPQRALLARADLVVHHAGYSTSMDAVLAGVPQTVLPLTADQPEHADAVRRLGLGRVVPAVRELPYGPVVDRGQLTPETVQEAARQTLEEPRHRTRSEELRDRLHKLPGPPTFVDTVEQVAR